MKTTAQTVETVSLSSVQRAFAEITAELERLQFLCEDLGEKERAKGFWRSKFIVGSAMRSRRWQS